MAASKYNEDWQSYCSYVYGSLQPYVPISELGAAAATCSNIASQGYQTKINWVNEYFGF